MEHEIDFLSDVTEQTTTRYVTMITPKLYRFDLAILQTERFYGKKIVIDLQSGISAVIGPDDLEEDGFLQHRFRLSDEQAEELLAFLHTVIDPIQYPE